MKTICTSSKTIFSIFSSVMIFLFAGCGEEQAASSDLKDEMIEEIQNKIPKGIPFSIEKGTIKRDTEKTTPKSRFGDFEAVAIATENLYELVPSADLKQHMPGYLTVVDINNVKSTLMTELEDICNSTNDLSKTSSQYVAVIDKINVARSLLDNIKEPDPYSFATIGISKNTKICVRGTITSILSDSNKWETAEIEIIDAEIIDVEIKGTKLYGRRLFTESKTNELELIIGKSKTDGIINEEIKKHSKIVSDAQKAVVDAEKAVAYAIKEVQDRISREIPLEIKEFNFTQDESKSNKSHIFGNFTVFAIVTEDMHERVPETDLRALGINYVTENEIKNETANLTAELVEIKNSTKKLPEISEYYVAATGGINAASLLLDNIREFGLFSFTKICVVKDEKISVEGTVSVTLSDAKECVSAEIKINGIESNGMGLTGRELFAKSKMNNSELIIESSETEMTVKDEMAKYNHMVIHAKKTIGEVKKLVDEALIICYDESVIEELIHTNFSEALKRLNKAQTAEPKNPKHNFWKGIAYYHDGKDPNAREFIKRAVDTRPEYRDDQRIVDAKCRKCEGKNHIKCTSPHCEKGKYTKQTINCSVCNNTARKKDCENCGETGKVQQDCSACKGVGSFPCKDCKSTGKFFYQALKLGEG